MSWITVRLVAPLDSQRQSRLFWLLLKGTLIASPLSVSAMSCRMLLEKKQLCNWSVSVGDRSFRKPADFFGGLSRRSWVLHSLKNFTLIHYSYHLKFKLNCQHFPLPVLFSVNKALWFVLSHFDFFFLLLLFSERYFPFICHRQNPAPSCLPFWILWCHWQLGISPCISAAGRMVQKISICSSRNHTFTKKTRSFYLFQPSQHKQICPDRSMSLWSPFTSSSVNRGGLACLSACREGSPASPHSKTWSI